MWPSIVVMAILGPLAVPLDAWAASPDGQYLRDWLVAGPVSGEVTAIAKIITALPKSELPAPGDGRNLRWPNGQQVTWNRYVAPGSIVNLVHALGQHKHVCALAHTTIRADRACQARFVVGSDDQLAIVLNGRIAYLYDKERPARAWDNSAEPPATLIPARLSLHEDAFTAELQAGENECLAIVGNGTGPWGFTLRVLGGEESRPPPLVWDAVDVLEQSCEMYSLHWRYFIGDHLDFARADYDDSHWRPLGPLGKATGVKDAAVVWFRCPVWARPSLVNWPCLIWAGHGGRSDFYLDGIRVATTSDSMSIVDAHFAPFSFTALHQVLAVRVERPAAARGEDSLPLRLILSGFRPNAHNMLLRMHRLIIMAILVLFLVFHIALAYYYPRRRANRDFCLTLLMALVTMLVLHAQEGSKWPLTSILYWIFLPLPNVCLLFGLVLVHALWGERISRGQLVAWVLLAAVLYGAAWVRGERTFAQVFAPLMTLEYGRLYFWRALGKVKGWPVYGVGLACFAGGQALFLLHEYAGWDPGFFLPYFWVYGFLALLSSVSVEIGREFAGAVRKLDKLTATLDARVQQVTKQREAKLLARARLETLRFQLNPHFLYNALNSVGALSREEPAQIPEMVRRLCDCLRYALHPKKSGLATLAQELQEVASYLYVEKVRFGAHLVVETEVSADSQAALVPEFFLQPLVENAIKHGMRTSPVPLRVVIRAACADHVLEIEVRNTGRWGNDARDQTSGVGLKNLKTRLDLLYGGGYRLKETEERGWVSVAIAIPFKSEDGGGVPPEKE